MVMALITTFATTPMVSVLYPPSYQKKLEAWKRGEIDWDGNPLAPEDGDSALDSAHNDKIPTTRISRVTVLLRLENLPGIFAFVDLLGTKSTPKAKIHKRKANDAGTIVEEGEGAGDEDPLPALAIAPWRPVEVHGERLVELTQRTSTVMQVSEVGELQEKDPIVNVFKTFGAFHNVAVSATLSIAPEDSFAEIITSKASAQSSDLLLIPWTETGAVAESQDPSLYASENKFVSLQHNQFVSDVLATSPCSTAIMVNRGFGSHSDRGITRAQSHHSIRSRKASDGAAITAPIPDQSHHIFFPFFGGIDDRAALRFVLQLASNINVTATIVQIIYSPAAAADPELELPAAVARSDLPRNLSLTNVPITSDDTPSSQSVDGSFNDADSAFFQSLQDSLPIPLQSRVLFETVKTQQPLHYAVVKSKAEVGLSVKNAGDLVILGRGLKESRSYIRSELVGVLASLGSPSGAGAGTRKCLGDVAEAIIVANIRASVLVFQAGGRVLERETEHDRHEELDVKKSSTVTADEKIGV